MITANFSALVNGLVANFTDTSIPEMNTIPITSWLWDFGDSAISNIQNPTHTYTTPGIYIVKLTIGDGTRVATTTKFLLLSTTPQLLVPLIEQIKCKLPGYDDDLCLINAIRKWQLLLQHSTPVALSDTDVFDETKWPPLFNALIAALVVYELLIELFNQYAIQAAQLALTGSSSSNTTSSTSNTSAQGAVKKLETGPSNAEWYNPQEHNNTETGTKLLTSYFKDNDSLMAEYKNQLCLLAQALGIYLHMCNCKPKTAGPQILRRGPCTPNIWQLTNCISQRCC